MPTPRPALNDAQRALLTLAIRRQQDAVRQFQPSPTQAACRASRARFRLLMGPNRSGKTGYAAWEIAAAARRLHPTRSTQVAGTFLVFAPSRDQLTDPWAKKLLRQSELKGPCFEHPFIPDEEIESVHYTYGAGEPTVKVILLKNGNSIWFFVSGDPHVWKRVQGRGMVLGIAIDESAGTRQLLMECAARLLDANNNDLVRSQAGGAWLLWSCTETTVNDALIETKAKCESPDFPDFELFKISPDECPAISMVEREKLRDFMDADEYAMRMLGTGSALQSMMVYPQWDDKRHVATADYVPDDTDNLWIGYDPGTNFTGIVLAAITKDTPMTLRVVRCWQPTRQTIEQDVAMIRDHLQGRTLEGWVYDQAARKVEKVGESVIAKLHRILMGPDGIKIRRGLSMGRSRYEDGVPLVRHYLTPGRVANTPPLIQVNPSPASGCGLLRQQMLYAHFTDNAWELKEDNISKGNDHLSDALRYLITRRPGWVKRELNPKLWGPGTGAPAPESGFKKHDPRVTGTADFIEQQRLQSSAHATHGRLARVRQLRRAQRS